MGKPLTLDLTAIVARAEAATEGPWIPQHQRFETGAEFDRQLDSAMLLSRIAKRTCFVVPEANDAKVFVSLLGWGPRAPANTAFIAAARSDVPALVARVRELERALEEIHLAADSYGGLSGRGIDAVVIVRGIAREALGRTT